MIYISEIIFKKYKYLTETRIYPGSTKKIYIFKTFSIATFYDEVKKYRKTGKDYEVVTIPCMNFYSFLYYRLKENEIYYSMNE